MCCPKNRNQKTLKLNNEKKDTRKTARIERKDNFFNKKKQKRKTQTNGR